MKEHNHFNKAYITSMLSHIIPWNKVRYIILLSLFIFLSDIKKTSTADSDSIRTAVYIRGNSENNLREVMGTKVKE